LKHGYWRLFTALCKNVSFAMQGHNKLFISGRTIFMNFHLMTSSC